jgi:hypothetical protein
MNGMTFLSKYASRRYGDEACSQPISCEIFTKLSKRAQLHHLRGIRCPAKWSDQTLHNTGIAVNPFPGVWSDLSTVQNPEGDIGEKAYFNKISCLCIIHYSSATPHIFFTSLWSDLSLPLWSDHSTSSRHMGTNKNTPVSAATEDENTGVVWL